MTAASIWFTVAIVGFVLSGLSLVATVVIFFKLKIRSVIADLSGKTVARGIKEMQNESSDGNKKGRFTLDRDAKTDKMNNGKVDKNAMALAHESKRLDKTTNNLKKRGQSGGYSEQTPNTVTGNGRFTEVMPQNQTDVMPSYTATNQVNGTAVLNDNGTAVLNDNGTAVLNDNGTAVLNDNGTSVLNETSVLNGTSVLNNGVTDVKTNAKVVNFNITRTIIEVHTDEVI